MADEEIVIQMHTFSSEELEILKTSLLVTGEQLLPQILNECPRLVPTDCMMHLLHREKEIQLEPSLAAQDFDEASLKMTGSNYEMEISKSFQQHSKIIPNAFQRQSPECNQSLDNAVYL